MRRALLEHYDRSARALPWRGERDPYRILVSEVMLQQTRVDTVKRYYERWLERFPDVTALADADENEVLEAWEGLGYYRRARNLHRAARLVREASGGALPADSASLRALPGVGEYTAGAVASIAFGEVAPAVDGNVRRVLARLFDVARPSPRWLRETAAALVDPERPGDWNQALMELGATVCAPRAPACDACPLARRCAARAAGTPTERPETGSRGSVPTAYFALGVFHCDEQVLLRRRPAEGLLGGLWAFPELRVEASTEPRDRQRSLRRLASRLGLRLRGRPRSLPRHEHRFTHLRAVYHPASFEVRATDQELDRSEAVWVDPSDTTGVALPAAQRRVLESWIDAHRGVAGGPRRDRDVPST